MLSKSRTLLDLFAEGYARVTFTAVEMEVESPVVHLPREVWEDMDSPQQITLTVVPGDDLNMADGQ